jgi:hypothetical protein
MGGVKPTWHNSRFNHSDRSEPYYLEYLNCREQGNALIERKFTAILKIGTEKRAYNMATTTSTICHMTWAPRGPNPREARYPSS